MIKYAENIVSIIQDYHCDLENATPMTVGHLLDWVAQFDGGDQEFILSELSHLFRQGIYVSREMAKKYMLDLIPFFAKQFQYDSIEQFLNESNFIQIQKEGKSQDILLQLLNEVLEESYGRSLASCGAMGVKNYIYIDDILATGKTFVSNIQTWLKVDDRLAKLEDKRIRLASYFFAYHTLGLNNSRFILKSNLGKDLFLSDKLFPVAYEYKIQNSIKEFKPELNLIYPTNQNDVNTELYLNSLTGHAERHRDIAYRPANLPLIETFFSSKENRIRLESIFLNKGIEIILRIKDESKQKNHRPLGKTYPSYHTFGTGTMFFTWRNISNTCPIVLWWDVPAHNWKPLFKVHNRGQN